MAHLTYIGIIPARYASTRFPGKPLALIGGKPMIQHVYEQAQKALQHVFVATDDIRISDCVHGFGGQAIMTRADHRCGTERCVEAYEKIKSNRLLPDKLDDESTIVINIQGDEPFIQPEQIEAVKRCFEEAEQPTRIATLVKPYTEEDSYESLENANTPKVIVTFDDKTKQIGTARMFSRSVIPYLRGIDKQDWTAQRQHYRHIGLYAYRANVLQQITQLAPTAAELAESLEQLRWLENGYQIRVATCQTQSMGIDTPEDLKKAEEILTYWNKN